MRAAGSALGAVCAAATAAALLLALAGAPRVAAQDSAAQFVAQFRERAERGAKLKFDTVRPFRGRFCYELRYDDDDLARHRVGTCLRGAIVPRGSKDIVAYVFADETGVYVSRTATANYAVVARDEGTGIAERFVRAQLGALRRIYACDDEVPDNITLPGGRVVRPRARLFDGCDSTCLAVHVLQRVPHLRLGRVLRRPVLCFGKLCATPLHRIFGDGKWWTMQEWCSEYGGCEDSVQEVAKALLATQEKTESGVVVRYGVVYGRRQAEFWATRAAQNVIDAVIACYSRMGDALRRRQSAGEGSRRIWRDVRRRECGYRTGYERAIVAGIVTTCAYR